MAQSSLSALPRAPSDSDPEGRGALALCFVIATLAHAAFGIGIHVERPPRTAPVVTEIELARPIEAPPPEAPPPEPPPPEALAPAPAPASLAKSAPGDPAPAAARAGALLTAKAEPASPATLASPVDFVTDPGGTSYGAGVVMRGGTADLGVRGATAAGTGATAAPPASAPVAHRDGLTSAANLSRAARLTEPDACRGYYPSEAAVDAGSVTITVVVRPGGEVSSASVLTETPGGQGFGRAARACITSKRFSPALDKQGVAVTAATTLHVRFSR